MEPEKDIFDQWAEERVKKPWIVRKLRWIPLWWNNDGKYLHKTIKKGKVMKFIEENFNNYKIPDTHQGNYFQVPYTESDVESSLNSRDPYSYTLTKADATMNVELKHVVAKLDSRMETGVYQDNPYDKAIDVESVLKHNLKAEWDFKFTRELLKKVYSIAKIYHMHKQYGGFKGWFYNLIGYKHLMWVGDLDFYDSLYNTVQQLHRDTKRFWMIVPIEILNDFRGSSDFKVIQNMERVADISYEGVWRDVDIYTFPAGPSDQIILGMKPQQETDQVISIAMKEPYYQYQERPHSPNSPMGEKMIGYNVQSAIFEIPGAKDNYVGFKYTMFRSNFWKWAADKMYKRSFVYKIVHNFKKSS